MLMIGTAELAERMYEAWRKEMDRVRPNDDPITVTSGYPHTNARFKPRRRWAALDATQQGIWRAVAREIGGALGDAMGATEKVATAARSRQQLIEGYEAHIGTCQDSPCDVCSDYHYQELQADTALAEALVDGARETSDAARC